MLSATSLTTITAAADTKIPVIAFSEDVPMGIPLRDVAPLEARLKKALEKSAGIGKLREFGVDWKPSSLQCISTPNEMNEGETYGICVVSLGAYMVQAKAAIVKSEEGYSVRIIYANVD